MTGAHLPVTLIGGYLGSGKTTLVNHLLRHAGGRKLAVLVNEFGALPIDEDLIVAEEDGLISIAGGCICCSFGNDLTAALLDLARRHPAPDHVLIETSGVAIPSSISASLSLTGSFEETGTIVLADAETIRSQAENDYIGDTITRQIADADLILLTKTDLVGEEERAKTAEWLAGQGGVRVVPVEQGVVPPEVVLGATPTGSKLPKMDHADRAYESVVLKTGGPLDAETLVRALSDPGLGLLRAKGFFRAACGQGYALQVVGLRAEARPFDEPPHFDVVAIGLADQLDRSALEALLTRGNGRI